MFKLLLIAFLIVPIIEIAILIEIGKIVGVGYTLLLVIVTAVLGATLLRQQGISTLVKVQTTMEQGRLPATELLEGLILLLAGALLLTPGFFSDVFGFMVLIPVLRQGIAKKFLTHFIQTRVDARQTHKGNIIEGEHWEEK